MSLPSAGTCNKLSSRTFANAVRISERLETTSILPLKAGDTINLQGYRATGEPDLVTVNFQFDAAPFIASNNIYVYLGDRAGTVVSAQEAHTAGTGVATGLALVKRSGILETPVVAAIPLNGPANTASNLTLVGANVGLLAGDSLKLELLGGISNLLKGAVLTVVIELA